MNEGDKYRLAKALCKADVDPESTDSPEVIWNQMRPSVQQAFKVRAEQIVRFIREQRT